MYRTERNKERMIGQTFTVKIQTIEGSPVDSNEPFGFLLMLD